MTLWWARWRVKSTASRLFTQWFIQAQIKKTSLAFVRRSHRWPVNYPHKGPVTRRMVAFDDVIMYMLHSNTMKTYIRVRRNKHSDGALTWKIYFLLGPFVCVGGWRSSERPVIWDALTIMWRHLMKYRDQSIFHNTGRTHICAHTKVCHGGIDIISHAGQ